jgi:hypothetical protein
MLTLSHMRPVLLLHIPKTAGTSLLLALQNAFGDSRVRRVHQVDAAAPTLLASLVSNELSTIACLAGHLPLHLLGGLLDQFSPFTVLRDPVERVLSLYRFLKAGDPAEHRRLGLSANFSLTEFVESKHPELHGQVNDGMTRFLCGIVEFNDPDSWQFWEHGADLSPLRYALANLKRIDFGFTDDMRQLLMLARRRWAIPYELGEYRENPTAQNSAGETPGDIHRIVTRNAMDLTLYRQAKAIYRARLAQPPAAPEGWNRDGLFQPHLDAQVGIDRIPGRRGFYEFEPTTRFAWLHPDGPSEVNFVMAPRRVRLRLHLYTVVPDYPCTDVKIGLNGSPLVWDLSRAGPNWFHALTEPTPIVEGVNRLTIAAPIFLAMAQVDPGSPDHRELAVALADIRFAPPD